MIKADVVLNGIDEVRNSGIQCPLENVEPRRCVYFPESLIDEIVSLLKAQEPRRPIKSPNYNYSHYGYNCSKCGHTLHVGEYRPNYCEECGQAVKWND